MICKTYCNTNSTHKMATRLTSIAHHLNPLDPPTFGTLFPSTHTMVSPKRIFIIGGTGAQGIPIVRKLIENAAYSVRILTRNPSSPQAQELAALTSTEGAVEFLEGTFASEETLRKGYEGCYGAFVNIDGFNCGEKTEMYWAIRAYEIAIECGVEHFVYGNLDYVYKKSGFKPDFRCGHYDGKGRVGEWILFQNKSLKEAQNTHTVEQKRMKASLFTTGPYIEMSIGSTTICSPEIIEGIVQWRVPLGAGAVAHVALEDCGHYVRWLLDHPDRADGLDLEVAIEHVHYSDLARAFENVTGRKARYVDMPLDEYWESGVSSKMAAFPSGYNVDPSDPSSMTFRQNFTGFWNMWKASGGNKGVVQRDYELLDEIHPERIRSVEQWLRREQQRGLERGEGDLWERVQPGKLKMVLKNQTDGRKGRRGLAPSKTLH